MNMCFINTNTFLQGTLSPVNPLAYGIIDIQN